MSYALKEGADVVVILNNDTVVDPDLILNLFNAAEDDKKRGAIVPKIYFAKGHEFHKDRYKESELGRVFWYAGGRIDWANIQGIHRGVDEVDTGQYDTAGNTELMTGCCVLFSKKALLDTGMFDERYFLYYEDADLNERLKRKGYTIYYAPKAVLWHINAGSTGGSGSKLQDYFISRNRMLFGITYAPLRSKIALVREGLRILRSGREWQKTGVRDYFLKKFGKGSYAL
jgi:GT2 family glycosyltransferase